MNEIDEMMEDEVSVAENINKIMEGEVNTVEKKEEKKDWNKREEGLIKFFMVDGREMVDARALHKMLEIKTQFTHWIERKIGSLKKGTDYIVTEIDDGENRGKHNRKDYAITEFLAYKIALTEGNGKSDEIIKYLLEGRKICDTPLLVTRRALELSGNLYKHQRTVIRRAKKYHDIVWKNLPAHEGQRPGRNFTKASKGLYDSVNDLLAICELFNGRHSQHTMALGMLQDLVGISSDQISKLMYAEKLRIGCDAYFNIRGFRDREGEEWYKVMDYRQLPTEEERRKRRKIINAKTRDDRWELFALKDNELQAIRDEVTDKAVRAKHYIEQRIKEAEMLEEEYEEGAEERRQLEAKDRELAAKDWDSLKTDEERKEYSEAIQRLADKEFDDVHGLEPGEDREPNPYCEGTGRNPANGY
jgi:phage anti-repressor protein